MDKLSRLVGIVACASALAAAGCASNSGVTPVNSAPMTVQQQAQASGGWMHDGGITYSVPHYMGTRYMTRPAVKPNIQLVYGNGPVLVKPDVYVVFWGYKAAGDTQGVEALMDAYFKAMGGSGHNNIYTQYYQVVGGVKTFIKDPKNQFGKITVHALDDDTNAVPAHPTDAQVAAEAQYLAAQKGYNPNASYVVATPHGKSSSGFGTQWCAYHGSTVYNGKALSYTNAPYMPDAGSSCGANFTTPPSDESGTDEGVTIVEGHEYGESVTDPQPSSGWYNFQQGEIGDICAWQNILNDPFKAKSYTSQPMFSNATSSCVHTF